MLQQSGERGAARGSLQRVLYVGESFESATESVTLSAALSAALSKTFSSALPDAKVVSERRACAALARLETEVVDFGPADSGAIDCVVAEADLPDADGADLLAAVGDLFPDVARVLVGESVGATPEGVAFVPARPADDLPERLARRAGRAVERRDAERARDRFADRFETLVQRSPDAMITIDEECEIAFANAATERVFGHDPASLVGDTIERLVPERLHESVRERVRELCADEGRVERDYVELTGRHSDGREIPLAISFTETERAGRHYFSCIVRDVTERKRLEERLGAEQRKTKELHEVAVMLEGCETVDEVCCLAVETAEQLLEFDLAVVNVVEDGELVPQAVSKGVPTDGYYNTIALDADDKLAARAYRAGETIRTEDLVSEGVTPAASTYRSALTVPMGDLGVFQAVAKDTGTFGESDRELAELLVSHVVQSLERINYERALHAERDRFAALFENIPEPTVDYELRDGRCIVHSVNSAFEDVFGYDADDIVGDAVEDRIVAPDKQAEAERHIRMVRNGEQIDAEVERETADGTRDFLLRNAEMPGEGTAGYLIYTDITGRKRLERDLAREKQKIEELHHVAVKLEGCDTPEEIYRRTVDAAEEILKFDICGVDIAENGSLVPKATSSEPAMKDYVVLRNDEGLAGETYQNGESYVIDDIRRVSDVETVNEKYRSILSIPFGDHGVLQAGARTPGEFDREDVKLAELLVSHASEALTRVQSENALREERDRFAALFENIPEPTVDYELRDGEPIVRSVNEEFENVFGYDADEVVGESLDDLITPEGEREEARALNERVRSGERVDAEVRREAADGVRDFLLRNAEVSGSSGNYVIYTDITDRKKREERHRSMTEDVLDNTDVGMFVLDDEFDVAWINRSVERYFGVDREEILSADKRTVIDEQIRDAIDEDEAFNETVTATYDDNSYVEEFTCHVLPGEDRDERHLHHRSRPIESGLYAGGRVELYYDVTERVQREAMLDALHGATRELMAAQSQQQISEIAVETVRGVLDLPHATVFRWNDEIERLEPFSIPSDTTGEFGDPPTFELGEGLVGRSFAEGREEIWEDAQRAPNPHEDANESIRGFCVLPLGDWGAMTIISDTPSTFDEYELDLARVLAANTEVALERAEHEAELADQREQLAELDRINAVIRDIDQLLVRASTREEIEQAVCDRLADSAHYQFAWTGGATSVRKRIEPTASAGSAEGYLDAVTIPVEDDDLGTGPAGLAIRSGEPEVVESIPDDDLFEQWREQALDRGFRSMAAIPLCYRDTVYGVLCVYADRSNALNERETTVLSELGETIGHAINAVESKRALLSDDVLEVELEIHGGEGFFSRVPREEGCTFTLEGVTMTADGSFVYFMTVDGADPERIDALAADADDVEGARLVNEHDDGDLFEFVYTGPSPLPALADRGGTLREATFTESGGRSVVELPRNADVRSTVEAITDVLPRTEVIAQREHERPERTVQEFRTALDDDLTDRQRSALEAAYYAGFFDWPRESTGEEVSESLGVSPPTFHQHLRVGERKLLSSFLDE